MKNKSRFLWYTVGIAVLILFSLILISSVLSVGEKLSRINFWVEIGFYVLVVFLVIFGIFNPIRIILCSPSFSIVTTLEENDPRVKRVFKKVAQNIVKNNELPVEEEQLLLEYKNYQELRINLEMVFHSSVKKQLNKIIIRNAKTVMISTAISQSARFDMMTVFTVNLKMIKELVEKCGYRPSMANLSKLTVNVFSTALIAEGLENLTMDDILPQSTNNALAEIPLIKPMMSIITQGIANALLTIRIGMVTRKYLFKDGNCITKEEIRRSALKESLKLLPLVLTDTLTFFPKRIVRLFTKKPKDMNTATDT